MEKLIGQQTITKAALYMRLSRDDEQDGESASIQNQRDILRQYAIDHGMIIAGEYADDGWSGTNFDRPDFKRMIADIEAGRINCVITKDLSRLGRNYIEVGKYTEYYFPKKGVRYIAIGDRVDTDEGDSDIAPFLNIFNEFHAKQTSKKTRTVFENKFKNGCNCSSVAPFGYEKDPEHKGHIIIDEEKAKIVRMIFDMADSGIGPKEIVRRLYKAKVECPGYIFYKEKGLFRRQYEGAPESKRYEWNIHRIESMLRNQYYIGNAVHYKERTPSFKDKTRTLMPKERWLVIEGTHEPIISKEQFQSIARKIDIRRRANNGGEPHPLSGIVRCADCGHIMRYGSYQSTNGERKAFLECRGSSQVPVKKCTRHHIRYDILIDAVLQDIKTLIRECKIDKDAMTKRLSKAKDERMKSDAASNVAKLEKLSKRRFELDAMLRRLYEDLLAGKILESNFNMMLQRIQEEQEKVMTSMAEIQESQAVISDEDKAEQFIDAIEAVTNPDELTRELANALIERIEVHEPEGKRGSPNKKQTIDIYYKFVGNIES